MRDFIRRALTKLDKLDRRQIHNIIYDLARENERFEGFVESSVNCIMLADLEHRVVLYNHVAAKFLLLSRFHSIYARKIWTVIADKDLSAVVRQTLEAKSSLAGKEFLLEVGGEPRLMSCTLRPLSWRGKVRGDLFYMTDVTYLRTQEARLRRAESLASLTTLAAGVAHEIKNPLGAIGIHIQLITKALQGKDTIEPSSILKNLNVITEEVERLNKIVVDFLFAVRPMNIRPQRRDLNAVLREILDFVEVELSESSISLEEKFTRAIPKILIDEKSIKQAILNIIKNAIAAMPQGGILTVATAKKGDFVKLTISDTGVGIPAENMDKIFEPYFTTKDFGSGLGLTNVYKIIKEHKADISVDSQPGQGAAFTISFPVPQGEQQLLEYEGGREDLQ